MYAYASSGRKRDGRPVVGRQVGGRSRRQNFRRIHDEPLQLGDVRYSSGTISPVDVVGGPCKGSCDDGAESSSICRRVPFFSSQTIASRL